MSLRYTPHDAARWAAFSGDYNPIHFDVSEASRLGMDRLCVHGMRALLDVKSGLSQAVEKHALRSDSWLFSSRLREPVWFNIPYQLSLSETHLTDRFQFSGKLINKHTLQTSIDGKLILTKPLELTPVDQAITLPANRFAAMYSQFRTVGNNAVPLWSLFDAILFRQLVNASETLEAVRGLFSGHKATCLGDILSQVQVVQTHHQTHFSSQLLEPAEEALQCASLRYAILPTLTMGEKTSGLVLVAGIQAWQSNEPLIAVTVTLKTGPLTA